MGRTPCCEKEGLKKGPWTPEEDKILVDYVQSNGHGSWRSLPKLAGLLRCGKSCRLRWTNYLRPDIKRGPFTPEEQKSIIQIHGIVGNKWSTIAAQLPGRTDNEVKNYWNTHLKKRLTKMGIDPETYCPATAVVGAANPSSPASSSTYASAAATRHMAQWENARLEAEARLAKESLLYSAATSTSNAVVGERERDVPEKAETDFFLRIWNSEVGRNFRSKERPATVDSSSRSSPAGSSTKCKDGKEGVAAECKNRGCDGGTSEEVGEETSSEHYPLYLDFVDDMGIGSLFNNGQLGGFCLFGGDMNMSMNLNDDCSLEEAFKWSDEEKTSV